MKLIQIKLNWIVFHFQTVLLIIDYYYAESVSTRIDFISMVQVNIKIINVKEIFLFMN